MKKILTIFAAVSILAIGFVSLQPQKTVKINQCIAGRGCCSHHGGECGCSNGRSKCCDGTLSPSCQCYKDETKGFEI